VTDHEVTEPTDAGTNRTRRLFQQRPMPVRSIRSGTLGRARDDHDSVDLVPMSYLIDGVEVSKATYYRELVREAKRLGLATWPEEVAKDVIADPAPNAAGSA
jgi:hypothetical protein